MPTTPWDPEHDALRDSLRRLVDGPLSEAAAAAEAGASVHALAIAHCADLGLLDLDDIRAEVVAALELGRLRSAGLVAVLLDAMLTSALGLTPLETAVTRLATVRRDGARASGEVPFAVGGAIAARLLVAGAGVVVDLADATVVPAQRTHSLRGAAGASVVLENAGCTPLDVAAVSLWRAELLEAAAAVGAGWRTWHESCDYAQQREAFGRPIAKFQVNRHALADGATKLTAAEALVHDLAWRWALGDTSDPAATRLYAGSVVREVSDRAVQLHGGYGYTMEFDPQRAWRDAHALRIGDDDRRRRIAQGVAR